MNLLPFDDGDDLEIVDQDALGEVIATMEPTLPPPRKLHMARLLAASPRLAVLCREIAANPSIVLNVEFKKRLHTALHFAGQDVSPCPVEAIRRGQ